jgi:hypothetical protein
MIKQIVMVATVLVGMVAVTASAQCSKSRGCGMVAPKAAAPKVQIIEIVKAEKPCSAAVCAKAGKVCDKACAKKGICPKTGKVCDKKAACAKACTPEACAKAGKVCDKTCAKKAGCPKAAKACAVKAACPKAAAAAKAAKGCCKAAAPKAAK